MAGLGVEQHFSRVLTSPGQKFRETREAGSNSAPHSTEHNPQGNTQVPAGQEQPQEPRARVQVMLPRGCIFAVGPSTPPHANANRESKSGPAAEPCPYLTFSELTF